MTMIMISADNSDNSENIINNDNRYNDTSGIIIAMTAYGLAVPLWILTKIVALKTS